MHYIGGHVAFVSVQCYSISECALEYKCVFIFPYNFLYKSYLWSKKGTILFNPFCITPKAVPTALTS